MYSWLATMPHLKCTSIPSSPTIICSTTATIRFVCVCDHSNVRVGQFAQLSGNHRAELTGIDEQSLALLLLVLGKEPQGYRNLRCIEKLGWHRNDAFHQIRIHDVLTDFTFTAALGGKRTVCQHHADFAVGCQMVDHVLQPCKVGVARRRQTVLPAYIIF